MKSEDLRSEHLAWVELYLRSENDDLHELWLTGQSHFGSSGFAFIVVHGVENDHLRRRAIRESARRILECLEYDIELEPRRDVYNIDPSRPMTSHDAMLMLSKLDDYLENCS